MQHLIHQRISTTLVSMPRYQSIKPITSTSSDTRHEQRVGKLSTNHSRNLSMLVKFTVSWVEQLGLESAVIRKINK